MKDDFSSTLVGKKWELLGGFQEVAVELTY